ncbi:hypothetical protein OOK58_56810 [Streptomyces sp. NBC_01728]|uniref:hypothetical protein n=1 Tax=unclassified Streptomyces TaxID=2593676 RepID=UPI00224D5808|nr:MULTISPECIES: hypothetical protein [unclassified Streptomyces]MCX4460214.1 hypothetical protein [Streptomyces sp. NBC_01719]MCX4500455.1 hypothetical protein [Streptomyces sp. NBC_01728]
MESTGCGARFETLTADGQLHVDGRPPIVEPRFEGEDAPDCNPICGCPRVPSTPYYPCGGCRACGQCWHCRGHR